jgi:hypothetical protein
MGMNDKCQGVCENLSQRLPCSLSFLRVQGLSHSFALLCLLFYSKKLVIIIIVGDFVRKAAELLSV